MINLQNCTVKQFLQMTEHKPIVCFCAGEKLLEFCDRFHMEKQILYAADNFKHGQVLKIGDAELPVISMEQLDESCRDAVCVLTSMRHAREIVQQLDAIPVCNDIEVYAYELLQDESREIEWEKNVPAVIPKKIHYCWFGNETMPEHFRDNIRSWEKYCPDYEIIEWNENNYDISKNTYMRQAYEKKAWGFVPDYARLDIVNAYGGIYFDTDVRVLRSFNPLLQYGMFCGFEHNGSVNFGQGFGAKKQHPILLEMLREYEKLTFIREDGSLNLTPSPVYQTALLEKHGLKKNGHVQQMKDFIVLSPQYFSPVNEFGYGTPSSVTFSIHQYAATWYGEEERKGKEEIIAHYEYILNRTGG